MFVLHCVGDASVTAELYLARFGEPVMCRIIINQDGKVSMED